MFKIEINTDNDAFAEDVGEECARLLRQVANKIEDGYTVGPLIDYNGTKVGEFRFTEQGD